MEESGGMGNISSNISVDFSVVKGEFVLKVWFWEALMWDFEHKEFVFWTHSFCCNTYEHNVWYSVVQGETDHMRASQCKSQSLSMQY